MQASKQGIDIDQMAQCTEDCGLFGEEYRDYLRLFIREELQKLLDDPCCQGWCLDNRGERSALVDHLCPLED